MTIEGSALPMCARCGSAVHPGSRFCPRCGSPLGASPPPGHRPWPPTSGLTPTGTLHPATSPGRHRVTTPVLVAVGVLLALLVGALGTALLLSPSTATAADPATSPAGAPTVPAPAPGTGAAGPDALSALQRQRTADLASVDPLIGTWVPQLSSKRVGDAADGRTWDPAAVLAEHRELRAQYPDARLVWSGDFGSFAAGDFWITLLADPSDTAEGANAWCDRAGFAVDHCYAKRLAVSGGPDGNTVLRDDAGGSPSAVGPSSVGPSSGTEPVVGTAGWASGVTGYGTVRPSELNANGNGTSYIEDVTWDSWGGATATGRGIAGWLPPWGSGPDTRLEPAAVVASDLGDCNGRWGYRRVGWYFPTKGDTEADAYPGYDAICTPY